MTHNVVNHRTEASAACRRFGGLTTKGLPTSAGGLLGPASKCQDWIAEVQSEDAKGEVQMNATTIGVDLAKNVF
ncbi:hypothetical protein, partial [Thauera sp. Sel9]|uniref:hypothetical protein n=1 Tax=Thauera sp. Sel9 TaxID=2974299 RepID=UPI0021E13DEE